jgi:DNA-binding NarL/FixJ family response regulator
VKLTSDVLEVRGEQELFARTAQLFASATEVACAANDLHTWAATKPQSEIAADLSRERAQGKRIRKIYRPGVLLDPSMSQHLREVQRAGADIRITPDEINETIILDRRLVILAGDTAHGMRSYSVLTKPEVARGVESLFEAAWRAATSLAAYDGQFAEIRTMAPRILELLASGCKDETAARALRISLRTYRRRVAELMAALGASSRFQAGVRARELGLM